MIFTRWAVGTAISLSTLALASCGPKSSDKGDTAPTPTSTTVAAASIHFDPCSVLSASEVSAITTDKVLSTKTIGDECEYHIGPDDDNGVQLTIDRKGGKEAMDGVEGANKMLGGIGNAVSKQGDVGKDVGSAITPPAGDAPKLGDKSVWLPGGLLAVLKGDVFVQVQPPIVHASADHPGIRMISDTEKRAISQKLAEAVLAKLGS